MITRWSEVCLILQEFRDFLGPGTYAIGRSFCGNSAFLQYFWFSSVKIVNFGCLPFKLKFKILKNFTKTVFVLLETTSGQNLSKIEQHLGSRGPKNPKKEPFHEKWINIKNFLIFNFTTTNATTNTYLMKVFHLAKSWA